MLRAAFAILAMAISPALAQPGQPLENIIFPDRMLSMMNQKSLDYYRAVIRADINRYGLEPVRICSVWLEYKPTEYTRCLDRGSAR